MKYPTSEADWTKNFEENTGHPFNDELKRFFAIWATLANDAYEQGRQDALSEVQA